MNTALIRVSILFLWLLFSNSVCQFSIYTFYIDKDSCFISFIVVDFNLHTVLMSDQTILVCAKSILDLYFGLLCLGHSSSCKLCFSLFFRLLFGLN